jgi:excisionase family DNA binding protein
MDQLLTVSEVAPMVRLTEQGLYKKIRDKQFPAIKIGNQIRISPQAVDAWIYQQLSGFQENEGKGYEKKS